MDDTRRSTLRTLPVSGGATGLFGIRSTRPATTATTVVIAIATENVWRSESGQVGRRNVGRWNESRLMAGRRNAGRPILGGCQAWARRLRGCGLGRTVGLGEGVADVERTPWGRARTPLPERSDGITRSGWARRAESGWR